jgi:AcrR family transcriptional regulator
VLFGAFLLGISIFRLFAAQGYEATRTLQIARKAGVTEPAVFYHFKNKTAFFPAVLEQAISVYIDRIDRLDPAAATAFERLAALIHVHFAVVAKDLEFMRILLRTCPVRPADRDCTCVSV